MTTNDTEVAGWIRGRLPDDWFTEAAEVTSDREEILVVGTLAAPEGVDGEPDGAEATAAAKGRISRFREDTREQRIGIAQEAEARYGRSVAWGASTGGETHLFTSLGVPVMTRLRQPERAVLDTLVDSGVARSRSEALAWCVKLVGDNEAAWIGKLRDALTSVERARAEGPA
jgi:hypothetical protein